MATKLEGIIAPPIDDLLAVVATTTPARQVTQTSREKLTSPSRFGHASVCPVKPAAERGS